MLLWFTLGSSERRSFIREQDRAMRETALILSVGDAFSPFDGRARVRTETCQRLAKGVVRSSQRVAALMEGLGCAKLVRGFRLHDGLYRSHD